MRLMGLIGIRKIRRLTDERSIEERRIVEGDRAGLIEGMEEERSLRVSFEGVLQFKPVILDLFSSDYCKMFPQSVVTESDRNG